MRAKESASISPIIGVPHAEVVAARYLGHRFRPHFHSFLTIGIIEAGSACIAVRNETWRITPETAFVIAPGAPHSGASIDPSEGHQYLGLHVDPVIRTMFEGSRNDWWDSSFVIKKQELRDRLATHIRRLAACVDAAANDWTMRDLLGALADEASAARSVKADRNSTEWVATVKALIQGEHNKRWTLEELSEIVGISRFHLLRRFKKVTGLSPTDYVLQLRVSKACELIASGMDSAAVAAECGFADQAHMIRSFKRRVGTTPGLYAQALACDAPPRRRLPIAH